MSSIKDRVANDIASEAATALGRDVCETGVDRLQAAIMADVPPVMSEGERGRLLQKIVAPVDVDAALHRMVLAGREIFPKDGIFTSRDLRELGRGVQARWELRAYPMGFVGVEGVGATPDEAIAAFRKAHKTAVLRKQIEDRAKRELDELAAIDAGTKNETNAGADDCQNRPHGTGAESTARSVPASSLDPNAAHKAEFLADFHAKADSYPCHTCGADCGPIPVDALTPEQMARFNAAGWVRECTKCLVREAGND